ncbi:MAG: DNA internalization-related competence protein ComEC/Rec2 [Bacillota bacterium]|nr:DNA internalization-related competence protein ComEC/Rec2 [Bacillota bacterium]
MQIKLVWLLCGWLLGIAFSLNLKLNIYFLAVLFFLLAGCCLVSLAKKKLWVVEGLIRVAPVLLVGVSIAAGAFWGTSFYLTEKVTLLKVKSNEVELLGQVVSPVKTYSNREAFLLKTSYLREASGWIKVNELSEAIIYRSNDLNTTVDFSSRPGDTVYVKGQVRIPKEATNPGEFDYRQHLLKQRIYSQLILNSEPVILEEAKGYSPIRLASLYKEQSIKAISKVLPGREGAVLAAMTFGYRDGLRETDIDLFTKTGLMHLFAVSGLHMGFVLVFGLWLSQAFRINKLVTFFSIVLLLSFYAALADFSVSAARAAIMGSLGMMTILWQRQKDFYTVLAIAAFTLTLANPYYLFQVGFQLSFMACWGIVFFHQPIGQLLSLLTKQKVENKLIAILTVPIAVQLALWPLLAYYFNIVSIAGIVTNLLAMGLVAVAVLIGLAILPISILFTPLAELVLIVVGGVIYLAFELFQVITSIPGAYFFTRTPTTFSMLLYYILVIFLMLWYKGSFKKLVRPIFKWHYPLASKIVAVILIILVLMAWVPGGSNQQLAITVLDVDQGDAILVTMPNGKRMLIDGGGIATRPGASSFDVGERVIVPYLQRQGISQLDLVVNTHGHYDHVAGLIAVIDNIKVKNILLSPISANSATYERFLEKIAENEIPATLAKRGQLINLDPTVSLQVLHPGKIITGSSSDLNENSIVIRLEYMQFSMLFAGDIEKIAMTQLVETDVPLTSTAYKTAHHGSSTGLVEEFLVKVNPKLTIIPVGRNSFGHPSNNLLQYFIERDVLIYRTDLDGAVIITTDGNRMWVKSNLKRAED